MANSKTLRKAWFVTLLTMRHIYILPSMLIELAIVLTAYIFGCVIVVKKEHSAYVVMDETHPTARVFLENIMLFFIEAEYAIALFLWGIILSISLL